jgi:Na+-driven multidrug efflux pump
MKQYGGDTAIAAYGIVNRVVFLFLMMVMGLNQGMQPIVGYNWGAKQNKRVWQTLRLTIICAEVVVITGFIMGECFPNALTHLFTDNAPIVAMADRGFRIDVMVFPIVGAQMVIGNFFQSIGHAGKSIFQSLTRQLLFLVPGLILLPPHFGLDGVWMAIPVSDTLSFFVSVGMLWWLVRKVRK